MKLLNIATACFVNENRELLVVRKQETTAWMLPGGKLDNQETPCEALIREVWEELQILLNAQSLTHLGSFNAVAANEADTSVHAHAFIAKLPHNQTPKISAEIAEMKWLPLHDPFPLTIAPLLKNHIIPALKFRTNKGVPACTCQLAPVLQISTRHASCIASVPNEQERTMTKPIPDTDPLKREPPGDVSKVPETGVDRSGRPSGKPEDKTFPHTGDKHRPQVDEKGQGSTQTPQGQNRPDNQNK